MYVVGVDFDNTIVCYDDVFHKVAIEEGLISKNLPVSKGQVRDNFLERDQEDEWTKLQGFVYGKCMLEAKPFPGVLVFFNQSKNLGLDVRIISHRTRYPFLGPKYDLHQAARDWIANNGFYEQSGLSQDRVFFELTVDEKLNRIKNEGCHIFIDDLPEFLEKPEFPENVRRILFDPKNHHEYEKRFERITSWNQVTKLIIKLS